MNEPTRRQIFAVSFVALLSPATRLVPGAAARAASHAAWLCPIAAAPFCVLAAALVTRFLRGRRAGEGLGETLAGALPRLGRAVLLLYGLWLALYTGFSLRSAASRFIYTIYTGSSPWSFVAVGLAVSLAAALGSVKQLARTAEIFRALLLLVIVPVLALGLAQLDWAELLPVSYLDVPGVLLGAAETFGTVCFALVNAPFLETGTPEPGRGKAAGLWSVKACLFLTALTASVIGRFGPELSGELTYPFFALVRNTGLFGVAERIEAFVTALWVLSDFVLCALTLMASERCLSLALKPRPRPDAPRLLRPGTLLTLASALTALACALVIAPDSRTMRIFSDKIVVAVNLAMLAVMFLTMTISILRKKQ